MNTKSTIKYFKKIVRVSYPEIVQIISSKCSGNTAQLRGFLIFEQVGNTILKRMSFSFL